MTTGAPSTGRDEPPALADPRRWGALVGLVGALTFAFSYSWALPGTFGTVGRTATVACSAVTLWHLFVRPRPLGAYVVPSAGRIVVYLLCVAGELALIAVGSRMLDAAGAGDLRPALIAAAVGLHFVPFAWAFHQRVFLLLGPVLVVLGGVGLVLGTGLAASGTAVAAGVAMAVVLCAWSQGAFAPGRGRGRGPRAGGRAAGR